MNKRLPTSKEAIYAIYDFFMKSSLVHYILEEQRKNHFIVRRNRDSIEKITNSSIHFGMSSLESAKYYMDDRPYYSHVYDFSPGYDDLKPNYNINADDNIPQEIMRNPGILLGNDKKIKLIHANKRLAFAKLFNWQKNKIVLPIDYDCVKVIVPKMDECYEKLFHICNNNYFYHHPNPYTKFNEDVSIGKPIPEQYITSLIPLKKSKLTEYYFLLIDNIVKSSGFVTYFLGQYIKNWKKGFKSSLRIYEKGLSINTQLHMFQNDEILKANIVLPISRKNYTCITKNTHLRVLNPLANTMIEKIESKSGAKFPIHQYHNYDEHGYTNGPSGYCENSFYMIYDQKFFIYNGAILTPGKKIINVKGDLIYKWMDYKFFRIYFRPKHAV